MNLLCLSHYVVGPIFYRNALMIYLLEFRNEVLGMGMHINVFILKSTTASVIVVEECHIKIPYAVFNLSILAKSAYLISRISHEELACDFLWGKCFSYTLISYTAENVS